MSKVSFTSLMFAFVGMLFVGLSIPLIQNRVPPNRYYGFRTARTLGDPKIWYEVNHISGTDLFLAGIIIAISSLTTLTLAQNWTNERVTLMLLLIMVFSLLGVVWHGFRVLNRI